MWVISFLGAQIQMLLRVRFKIAEILLKVVDWLLDGPRSELSNKE